MRKLLITSALPYANGPIHLGHLVEHIQTDIWVRFQRFNGNDAYYFCADDTHGTPVMIAAKNRGITPEQMVEQTRAEHYRDLTGFSVEYDHYYTTNSKENEELSSYIYSESGKKGHIVRKSIRQLYCEHDEIFLPDRFVKGKCPSCGAEGQYGDSCEVCGATYNPADLVDPGCSICGRTPVFRESEHLFFRLSNFKEFLIEWISTPGRVDTGIRKKMGEWLDDELRDWDISRDGPYFGFQIPGETEKYFYVWLDAPIGYMAASKNFFVSRNRSDEWERFWRDESTEIHHFIGKDIVYFHTLFWPALLHAGGFRSPSAVHVHGFLTVNGEKMSKSRGTFVRAETYLRHLDPQCLRFFYASKLSGGLDDLDLSEEEFINRYNADVVGNLTNIFSRLCTGIAEKLEHRLADGPSNEGERLRKTVLKEVSTVMEAFESRNYAKAVRQILAAGDAINRFVSEMEPWKAIKTDPEAARQIVTDALVSGRIVAGFIKPILPVFTAGIEELLNLPEPLLRSNLEWTFPANHSIRPYRNLAARVDPKDLTRMFDDEKGGGAARSADHPAKKKGEKQVENSETEKSSLISIDELGKVELRIGRIEEAETVEGADRLLRIVLDVGEEKPRQVFAGIRGAYEPEELKGLSVVAVTNLQPRKMKFGVSEAMLLAAGDGKSLTLFTPHRDGKPGDRLR